MKQSGEKTHFEKLIRVGGVGQTLIERWLGLAETVFGGHRSLPGTNVDQKSFW